MHRIRRLISIILVIATAALGVSCTQYHTEGAVTGGAIGGIAGALLDHRNPWRGGVIGAALGAVAGATIADISMRGSREAAETGKPVQYKTEDGRGVYRADPMDYDANTKCRKVRERVWRDGELVQDETREICESEKYERGYGEEERAYRHHGDEDRGGYREERGGPPPWAPAHGYRAKYHYRYYPSLYIYFNIERDIYFYRSGDRWVQSTRPPRGMRLEREGYVMLDMDEARPYVFHRDVIDRYPPGYFGR